jgi:hypothetical protein
MYDKKEIIVTEYYDVIESVYPDYKNLNKDLKQIIIDKGDEMQRVTNVKADRIFDRSNYSVKVAPGKLVIWPGHLSHTVPVQTCDHDRIAISGNIQVVVKEKQ